MNTVNTDGMTAMIVGDWRWNIYEKALADGFECLGVSVHAFRTEETFLTDPMGRLQKKIRLGYKVSQLNRRLLEEIQEKQPDFVFFNRNELIKGPTFKAIKQACPDTILIGYHNDNPYVHHWKRLKYRHFFDSLKYLDINYVYRPANIRDARCYGASDNRVLMPYYIKGFHDQILPPEIKYDISFIGHYEDDGRAECCEYLLKQGIRLNIVGRNWEPLTQYPCLSRLSILPAVNDERYVNYLNASKIALVFLSKRNMDVYTRRCFEIPAAGVFMLSWRTPELQALFAEGQEAEYFSSKEELLEKVNYYLKNDTQREAIAAAGKLRCEMDRHHHQGRAEQILEHLNALTAVSGNLKNEMAEMGK